MFKCLFGHDYEAVSLYHFNDVSYISDKDRENGVGGIPSCSVTYICSKCGKTKTETVYSTRGLTLEQLNKHRKKKSD